MEDCIDISMSKNGNNVAFVSKYGRVFMGTYSDYIARKKKNKVVRFFYRMINIFKFIMFSSSFLMFKKYVEFK